MELTAARARRPKCHAIYHFTHIFASRFNVDKTANGSQGSPALIQRTGTVGVQEPP